MRVRVMRVLKSIIRDGDKGDTLENIVFDVNNALNVPLNYSLAKKYLKELPAFYLNYNIAIDKPDNSLRNYQ